MHIRRPGTKEQMLIRTLLAHDFILLMSVRNYQTTLCFTNTSSSHCINATGLFTLMLQLYCFQKYLGDNWKIKIIIW